MHTVRNRIASRPPTNKAAAADFKPPAPRTSRQELSLIARGGTLPESREMPCSMAPEQTAETRPQKRRNAKGKKARKAAARKAAAAATSPALAAKAHEGKGRGGKRRHGGPTAPPAPPPVHPVAELEPGAMRDLCLQAEPALALLLPSRPEPLVEAADPAALPEPVPVPETAAAQVPLLALPERPEPLVELPAPVAEAAVAPAAALAALADAQALPLPRSRALVPARRQGLVDVIAFLLRDSGRRLARWSAKRHKTRAEQAALRQAEARQINLRRELEALDALRRVRS